MIFIFSYITTIKEINKIISNNKFLKYWFIKKYNYITKPLLVLNIWIIIKKLDFFIKINATYSNNELLNIILLKLFDFFKRKISE